MPLLGLHWEHILGEGAVKTSKQFFYNFNQKTKHKSIYKIIVYFLKDTAES